MVSATGPLAVDAGQRNLQSNLTGTPPPANALFRGRIVNHVTLRVQNVDRFAAVSRLIDTQTNIEELLEWRLFRAFSLLLVLEP